GSTPAPSSSTTASGSPGRRCAASPLRRHEVVLACGDGGRRVADEILHGDRALPDGDQRAVAAVGDAVHRAAHGRGRVAALRLEDALAVAPEHPDDGLRLLRGDLPRRVLHGLLLADAEVAALQDELRDAVRGLEDPEDGAREIHRLDRAVARNALELDG